MSEPNVVQELFPEPPRDPKLVALVEALELYGALCPSDVTRWATVGFSLQWMERNGWTIEPPASRPTGEDSEEGS